MMGGVAEEIASSGLQEGGTTRRRGRPRSSWKVIKTRVLVTSVYKDNGKNDMYCIYIEEKTTSVMTPSIQYTRSVGH